MNASKLFRKFSWNPCRLVEILCEYLPGWNSFSFSISPKRRLRFLKLIAIRVKISLQRVVPVITLKLSCFYVCGLFNVVTGAVTTTSAHCTLNAHHKHSPLFAWLEPQIGFPFSSRRPWNSWGTSPKTLRIGEWASERHIFLTNDSQTCVQWLWV